MNCIHVIVVVLLQGCSVFWSSCWWYVTSFLKFSSTLVHCTGTCSLWIRDQLYNIPLGIDGVVVALASSLLNHFKSSSRLAVDMGCLVIPTAAYLVMGWLQLIRVSPWTFCWAHWVFNRPQKPQRFCFSLILPIHLPWSEIHKYGAGYANSEHLFDQGFILPLQTKNCIVCWFQAILMLKCSKSNLRKCKISVHEQTST